MCKKNSMWIKTITAGILLGTSECQYQFRNRKWNCTTVRRSLRKVLMRDTRETGFVNAITAAAITYEITRACTRGDLVECSCVKTSKQSHKHKQKNLVDPKTPIKNTALVPADTGDWEWGGCGDNINFGYKKSKDFLDARYRRRSDIKTLVKLHNHDSGRLAIKSYMTTGCKCHGLSGSCTLRTCWQKMPPFREVGNRIKERFDGAVKVIARNDGRSFMPEGQDIKSPSKTDLVYTEDSPDFCRPNKKTGSLGTQGRQCIFGSQSVGGCDLLCCSRGFNIREENVTVNCKCRFIWCCEVTCESCIETVRKHTCN